MKKLFILFSFLVSPSSFLAAQAMEPVDYVDPFIGTTNYSV